VSLDFSDETALAATDISAMMARLNILFAGGMLSEETISTITEIVDVTFLEPAVKLKVAIYLILISPDYIIQK
jgi:hypothetical protein